MDISTQIECAVVVKYDQDSDFPPQITYIQHGSEAEKLVLSAKLSGIPVIEDNSLGKELLIVQEGDYIPERLWKAVVKILIELAN